MRIATVAKLGLAASLALSFPAWSQETGLYAGGSLGRVDHRNGCAGANTSTGFPACDNKDGSWRLFGGYQLNRYFSAELGVADLGQSKSAPGFTISSNVSGSFKATAWDLVGVGSLPLIERFSLTGTLGLYRAEVESEIRRIPSSPVLPISGVGPQSAVFRARSTGLTLGLGARYEITRAFAVRAGWQRYDRVGDAATTGQTSVDTLSIGVMYRF